MSSARSTSVDAVTGVARRTVTGGLAVDAAPEFGPAVAGARPIGAAAASAVCDVGTVDTAFSAGSVFTELGSAARRRAAARASVTAGVRSTFGVGADIPTSGCSTIGAGTEIPAGAGMKVAAGGATGTLRFRRAELTARGPIGAMAGTRIARAPDVTSGIVRRRSISARARSSASRCRSRSNRAMVSSSGGRRSGRFLLIQRIMREVARVASLTPGIKSQVDTPADRRGGASLLELNTHGRPLADGSGPSAR